MLLIGKHLANEVLKIFEPALFSVDTKPITYMDPAFNALLPLILSESMYRTISRQKSLFLPRHAKKNVTCQITHLSKMEPSKPSINGHRFSAENNLCS